MTIGPERLKRCLLVLDNSQIVRGWLLLLRDAGMVVVFGIAACVGGSQAVSSARSWQFLRAISSVSRVNERPQAPVSLAEKEMAQGIVLRKKLTHRDLNAAIRLFFDSAARFATAGDRKEAAHAELEAGDTYQMISRYHDASPLTVDRYFWDPVSHQPDVPP